MWKFSHNFPGVNLSLFLLFVELWLLHYVQNIRLGHISGHVYYKLPLYLEILIYCGVLCKIVVALEVHGQRSVCESASVYFSLMSLRSKIMISRSKMTSRLSLLQCEIVQYLLFS